MAHEFPARWPTFFDDLVNAYSSSLNTAREHIMASMFLRICKSIHEEVVCLLISRANDDLARNSAIKDAMREKAVFELAAAWFSILERHSAETQIVNQILEIIGQYVSWIDINLILKPAFLENLFRFMLNAEFQAAACECLGEIVSKGMKAEDKLTLIQTLNMIEILNGIPMNDEDTREHFSRLVNVLGTEIIKAFESTAAPNTQLVASNMLVQIFPFFIRFLGDEYDDISTAMFPFLTGYLGILKKAKKQNSSFLQLMEENNNLLMRTIVMKLKIDEDAANENNQEEEALFFEMRRTLKANFDSLFLICPHIAGNIIPAMVSNTFSAFELASRSPGSTSISYSDIELAIYLIFIYGEANKGGAPQYVEADQSPSILSRMLVHLFQSRKSHHPIRVLILQAFRHSQKITFKPCILKR